ncbi:MAG: MGMT family protein [Candidatus Nanopusillus acidilobi]
MIKIFDYELYSGYIMLNGKIVAYSLHNNMDILTKNLVKIAKFHNLNGDLIFDENLDKFFQEKINRVLNNKEKFNIDLSKYRYKDIYEKILEIPFGKTITYKELYNSLNKKYNMLQILNAIKNNPFIILIPCHRVVKENNISGYTPLGVEFKRKLLEYEHNLLINK